MLIIIYIIGFLIAIKVEVSIFDPNEMSDGPYMAGPVDKDYFGIDSVILCILKASLWPIRLFSFLVLVIFKMVTKLLG